MRHFIWIQGSIDGTAPLEYPLRLIELLYINVLTTNGVADEVLLKRVVVSIDGKGKLLLNVTWVNQTMGLGGGACSGS